MKRSNQERVLSIAALAIITGVTGCVAETDEVDGPTADTASSQAGERALLKYLEEVRGIDPAYVVIRDDQVVVDGDAIFVRDELEEEAREAGFLKSDSPSLQTPQGYYYSWDGKAGSLPAAPGGAATGHYNFSAAVPEAWRNSFRAAFKAWSDALPNDCVNLTEGTGAKNTSQLTITVGEAGTAADGKPASALATFPVYISPKGGPTKRGTGRSITIDTSVVNTANANFRLATALHEIGHTLGFNHPWVGKRLLGTAQNGNSGCCEATYFTVMDYSQQTGLRADDIDSLKAALSKRKTPTGRFGAPVESCEY